MTWVRPGDGEIDPDIVEACRHGDRDALRALYEAYKDRVYSIAFYFFHGDAAAASDVSQQVFLKLIDGIARFRGDATFSTWLYRVVVNACVDRSRRWKTERGFADASVLEGLPDQESTLEQTLVDGEMATAVREAVAGLPVKLRAAVLLRYFDDLSYDQMAGALGCSIGTVASRLSRAHRLLATRLAALRQR